MSTAEIANYTPEQIQILNDAAAALRAVVEAVKTGDAPTEQVERFMQQLDAVQEIFKEERSASAYKKILSYDNTLMPIIIEAGSDLKISLAKPVVAAIKGMEQQFSQNLPYQDLDQGYSIEQIQEIEWLTQENKLPTWTEVESSLDQNTQNSLILLRHVCTSLGEESDVTDLVRIYLSVDKNFDIPTIAKHVEKLGDDHIIFEHMAFMPLAQALGLVREEQEQPNRVLLMGRTIADKLQDELNETVGKKLVALIEEYASTAKADKKQHIKDQIKQYLMDNEDISKGAIRGTPAVAKAAETDIAILKMFFDCREIGSPGLRDDDLRDALHAAIREGKQENIEFLINKNPSLIHLTNRAGDTALHVAIKSKNEEAIAYLVSKGALLHVKNNLQYSPVLLAFEKEKPDAVRLNAVLDGLAKCFDAEKNEKDKQEIEALREQVNNDIINRENVDAKFKGLIDSLSKKQENEKALKSAIVDGKNSFSMMMDGKIQKQKVSSILGIDPRKMTPLQRLEAVDNIEALKAKQETELKKPALKWIHDNIEKLGNKLKKNPNSAKAAKKFKIFSEFEARIKGNSTFSRDPNPDPNGEAQLSYIPEADENGKRPRLKLVQEHFEKHKDVLASKAVSAFATFIEVITHLPRMNVGIDAIVNLSNISVKQKPMSQSSSNVANEPSRSRLRRSKSSPILINDISQQSDISNFGKSKSSTNVVSNIPPQLDPALEKGKALTFSKLSDRSFLRPPRQPIVEGSTNTEGITPIPTPV